MTNSSDIPDNNELVYDINYKDLLLNLLHETHVISNIISNSSELISRSVSGNSFDKPAIEFHAPQIYESAYLLSLLLNMTEFEINPGYFETQAVIPNASLFGKFKKAAISFKRLAKNKKIGISLTSNASASSSALVNLYPIIDILPYVLLDNAIKYSPTNSTVNIDFHEDPDFVNITISSLGPLLKPGELDRMFEKGFRGYEASQIVKLGSGRGLAFAKHICDLHKAEIKVEVGKDDFTFKGVSFADFVVVIRFSRH